MKKKKMVWTSATIKGKCGCVYIIDVNDWDAIAPGDVFDCETHGTQPILRVSRVGDK